MIGKKSSLEHVVDSPDIEEPQSSEIHDLELKYTLSKKEKWFIVALISLISFFSPFTANIYFPAIPTMARAFNKSIELINLTVTAFVILQGTAPMVWGTLSDNLGRRPIAGACLLILMLSCIGIALTPTSAYWLLLVLRCLQAAGSAPTLALGAGVISDISTPAERGGFYGVFALGPMAGPALGPVLGGALARALGWRSIFWFLCIAVAICLVILITLLPETLPSRQKSQSRSLKLLYNPLIPIIGRKNRTSQLSSNRNTSQSPPHKPRFQNPLRLLLKKNIVLTLLMNSSAFSVFFAIVTSLSTLFERTYPFLNELTIGLCFLATGGSMALGTGIIGRFLDWRYQVEKRQLRKKLEEALGEAELERKLKEEDVKDVDKLVEFPLERARLKYLAEATVILGICSMGHGWCLQQRVMIAGPLVLQVIIGLISMAIMNSTTTLLIDQAPGQGSSVSACSNLFRCTSAAVIVTIVQPIINAIGVGWTYVLFAIYVFVSIPCAYVLIKFGPRWRAKERESIIGPSTSQPESDPSACGDEKRTSGSLPSSSPVSLISPNVESKELGEVLQEKREEYHNLK
ncbi:hypothetical protein AGABI1DRAFT_69524 [Agaricus bisporus var. burnettii JB137-S8]|uniref:Major facilitator superfamily (MFS) profile domain-containing protein n=1 Tax=Agaricus bisporus var. burnettii (strain JB137-S8 / ATCC MYA-4627 / FGSC 10392) TaxID=597362 RepID=K5Y587_AGABU|nr:uncharacterized protein AGABI1DRAFT_69524 [Agaricus bisporus var. burnettii JB137-S8]EKM83255.1 hypothetical protein AGABI1DRAFT_69524 [Agaricus bisporus var. burnettii JB137-S8]